MRNPENVAHAARQVSVSAQLAIPTLTMLNFSWKSDLPSGNAARRDGRDRWDRRSWSGQLQIVSVAVQFAESPNSPRQFLAGFMDLLSRE
jgi:hypothetical protein